MTILHKQNSFKPSQQAAIENKPFAEIIESSLSTFLAQSWQWDAFPEFGSLVQIQQNETVIYGCVTQIKTGSMDPMRYPFPYKKTEKELLAEQPQIFEFLKTTFTVQVIGYQEAKKMYYVLPSKPCKIHSFVQLAPLSMVHSVFSSPDFLHLLFTTGNHELPVDELLLAIIRNLAVHRKLTSKLLEDFCQTFSLITGNDYRRLKILLQRIERIQS